MTIHRLPHAALVKIANPREAKKKADATEMRRKKKEATTGRAQQRVWMDNVHAASTTKQAGVLCEDAVLLQRTRGFSTGPAAADFPRPPHGPRVGGLTCRPSATCSATVRAVAAVGVYYAAPCRRAHDTPAAAPPCRDRPTMPRRESPKQAGGGVKPDIYSDPDEMRAFVRRFK